MLISTQPSPFAEKTLPMSIPMSAPDSGLFRAAVVALAVAAFLAGCEHDALQAGRDFLKKDDYPAAVIEFKNAVQEKPDSVEARLALADALERIYDLAGTEQHLRKALEAGGDADVLVPRIALLMLDRSDVAKIVNEFKDRHLKSPAADSDLRAAVAAAYVAQKQYASADEQLKAATVATPATKLSRAQWWLAQDKREQALGVLDASLSSSNADWWVLRGLGRIYEANGQREPALQLMERAYKAAPWHRGLMGEYGEFLVGVGQLDAAIAIRARLKKLAPGYYWTHYLDALVLSRQGRLEDSLAAGLKVLSVAPEHLSASLLVAAAELQKNDLLMASKRLEKIAQQYPYSLPMLQLMAESQIRLGKPADAADTIKRGLVLAPTNPRFLSLQAESELARGQAKEATATLTKLSASEPGNGAYLLRLAELSLAAGKRSEASKYLDRTTEADKDNAALRDRVISLALAMGDIARVRQLADYTMKASPKDPRAHLTMAAALDAQKDPVGAWRETSVALDAQPAFQPALSALGMLAKTPEQKADVLARYEKAIQAKPSSAQTYLEYARLLRVQKNDPAARLAILEKGVVALPDSTTLREALVQEHIRSGKPDTALSVAQTGAFANNAPPEATALLASVYERAGSLQQATEAYRKLSVNYPQRADWRLKLAELEIVSNRKKEATTILRALMTERPFDPIPYITLAKLTWPDNLEEALSIARELQARSAQKLTGMLLEGDLLVLANQPDQAIQQFSKAVKAGGSPTANLRIVNVLDGTQKGASAEQELADVMRKFPDDPSVVGFAAQRARAQGQRAKAVELLQKMASRDPRNPIVLNDLAWAQVEAKQPQALSNAQRAADLAPNNPQILDTLGVAQTQAGQHKDAVDTLRVVVNMVPEVAAARLHLAQAYIAAGKTSEASSLMQSLDSKKLNPTEQSDLARMKSQLGA
jgi:putative PEP-CTERM system TPR-repeat lipoprotein